MQQTLGEKFESLVMTGVVTGALFYVCVRSVMKANECLTSAVSCFSQPSDRETILRGLLETGKSAGWFYTYYCCFGTGSVLFRNGILARFCPSLLLV